MHGPAERTVVRGEGRGNPRRGGDELRQRHPVSRQLVAELPRLTEGRIRVAHGQVELRGRGLRHQVGAGMQEALKRGPNPGCQGIEQGVQIHDAPRLCQREDGPAGNRRSGALAQADEPVRDTGEARLANRRDRAASQWLDARIGDVKLDVGQPVRCDRDSADRTDLVAGHRHPVTCDQLPGVVEPGV